VLCSTRGMSTPLTIPDATTLRAHLRALIAKVRAKRKLLKLAEAAEAAEAARRAREGLTGQGVSCASQGGANHDTA